MSLRLLPRIKLILSHVQCNQRCIQRLFSTRNNSREEESRHNYKRACFAAGVGIIGYASLREHFDAIRDSFRFPTVNAATVTIDSLKGRRDKFNFIADVVAVSSQAVVYIEIKDATRIDLFTGQRITVSNGSGFIVQPDGLILTNAHVVVNKPNSIVEVKLQDGTKHLGFVEDVDVQSDLATVRIPVKNLPTMKLGSSASLRPGEWVVAMGSPIGLSNTVTAGVISSTERASQDLGLRGRDMVYIQTDAPITFGNSGGPLVNLDGEAIGINSMKIQPGISFAIPIDYVKNFLAKSKGKSPPVSRKYLGITMLSLNPTILAEIRTRNPEMPRDILNGIFVWKVIIGSPAHTGGLQPGDIVTSINNKGVAKPSDIYDILESAGSKITVQVVRGDRRINIVIYPEDSH